MIEELRILIVEDDPSDRALILREMKREFPFARYVLAFAPNTFAEALESGEFDAVILDWQLGWSNGTSLMKTIRSRWPELPVVMYSGAAQHEDAAAATRVGISEFVLKSATSVARLPHTVRSVMQLAKHQHELRDQEQQALIGQLTNSVAHQIAQPLEALGNLLYLLTKEDGENKSQILQNAKAQLRMLEEIATRNLGFRRRSSDRTAVTISHLVEDVLALYRRNLDEQQVEVSVDANLSEPVKVFPAEVRQLVSNLVSNAIDALPRGGKLRVRIRQGREWIGARRRGIRITIADNGHGISPKMQNHLFEPFRTTKGPRGTGLGLWVSRGVAQAHNGTIRIRTSTEQGRNGTCVSVFLPHFTAEKSRASGQERRELDDKGAEGAA